jgi:glycosyltransferase involved in cell wall biosynthesis
MRVLFLMNSASGGATQGIVDLLQGIPAEQYEAYLVLPHQPDENQAALFSELVQRTFVVPMTWWNRKTEGPLLWRVLTWAHAALRTWGRAKPTITLCNLIRSNKIDLVYTSTAMILEGAIAARLCRVPHVWHIKEGIGQKGRVKFWLPDWLLVRIITGLSAEVLVMTRFIGSIFERYKLGGPITQVYDGVYLNHYAGDLKGVVLRHEFGILDGQLLIGMVASPSSIWKEHDVFIEMAAHLISRHSNLRFVVFGTEPQKMKNPAYNGPWKYFQTLKKRVSELGLDESFVWAGIHPDIPQMMAALDLLVHPCRIEPFGRIAIEAMAARHPVIGPSSGGIAEIVIDGYTGYLVTPGDAKAFAGTATKLIQDDNLRRNIGNSGFEHVAANFSMQEHIKVITDLFDNIINHPV